MATLETVLNNTRPWSFPKGELTAGLRQRSGDSGLVILQMEEYDVPLRRPAMGRIRGLRATCRTGRGEEKVYNLVLKEPLGVTRAGTAGAGLREVYFYRTFREVLPIPVAELVAADNEGQWLVFDLLSEGQAPESWSKSNYLHAIDQLAVLHDHFWGLDADLKAYPWLARPLDADLDIYTKAARAGIQRLLSKRPANRLTQNVRLVYAIQQLIQNAGKVAAKLRKAPGTLLHGDYWPGNLHRCKDGKLVVYDWQRVGIGPGVLDLFNFIQKSMWWFEKIPVSSEMLVARYRQSISTLSGYSWSDEDWTSLWDYAILWTFLSDWIDLLPDIPAPVLETRYERLESYWLRPVEEAVHRRLLQSA